MFLNRYRKDLDSGSTRVMNLDTYPVRGDLNDSI